MLDSFKQLIANQYDAVFCALHECVTRCPEDAWESPIVELKFCQVAFHTLFFADFYLGKSPDEIAQQDFHQKNEGYFRDYEELEYRQQVLLYDRPKTIEYLEHCRAKAKAVIAAESEDQLNGPSGFPRRDFCRAEMHAVNIRHIHHHVAQLSLWLKLNCQENIPWFGSGWAEVG
jgi:hypothetical protein